MRHKPHARTHARTHTTLTALYSRVRGTRSTQDRLCTPLSHLIRPVTQFYDNYRIIPVFVRSAVTTVAGSYTQHVYSPIPQPPSHTHSHTHTHTHTPQAGNHRRTQTTHTEFYHTPWIP